ncbi:MAG TPA: helicase HerA-like domain-containing protein [Methyloceanibacter sp.]|nr:helicase HerA-like domain-containing protein [Methyloceanibacter sp.]
MAKRKAAPKDDAVGGGAPQKAPDNSVYIGRSVRPEYILLRLANRHGLITGATGTGKTVTLQGLAESFSDHGVPVFCADVKGDLSGIAEKGEPKGWIEERASAIGFTPEFRAYPVIFWDLFGKQGLPIRTTVSDMGPLLLSRLMDLSDAQEGVLNIAFKIAGEEDLPLITLKNLQTLLEGLAARADTLTTKYGNITRASVGSIQRSLLVLEQQGGEHFFGKPVLDIEDLMQTKGRQGYISVLAADRLMDSPRLYATFLLFLLSDLFENLPEVGDPEKPKLVFFFDEAHLLFKDAPKALLEKVEQVVRLIRSKGVGVYFVTQNPLDIPDTVSRQLGNRVQHALRAFTPMEQKAVKAAATTFRPNPAFDTEKAIMELGIGEALVSTLDEKGQPTIVERTLVRPPNSRVGPITSAEREQVIEASPVKYPEKPRDDAADQERLQEWADQPAEAKAQAKAAKSDKSDDDNDRPRSSGGSRSDSFWTTVGKTIVRTGVPLATKMLTDALKGRNRRS